MKALKERGVGETTILGQWWCKGLFLGGKACLYQGENEEAVNCLRKGSKVRSISPLACYYCQPSRNGGSTLVCIFVALPSVDVLFGVPSEEEQQRQSRPFSFSRTCLLPAAVRCDVPTSRGLFLVIPGSHHQPGRA